MKKLMIMGGLIGFLIGIIFALMQGVGWPALFWRAGIGSLAAGLLLRWGAGVRIRGLRKSYAQCITAEAVSSSIGAPKK